jgi:hypothetical protein
MGSSLTAGVLDEISGKGRTKGVGEMSQAMLEQQVLAEMGHQIGSGLSAGATDITPEQQQRLEAAIDGLITVAAMRTGQGIRNDVSPEMREMIRKDIVQTLSEGFRGELGDSLDEMSSRVISHSMATLKDELRDDDLRYALSDALRESIYIAMREGQGGTPSVGETLEDTLTDNMLQPIEGSVAGIQANAVDQLQKSKDETTKTLKGVVSAGIVLLVVSIIAFMIRGRQLARANVRAEAEVARNQHVTAALDLLDEGTRARILDKVSEYGHMPTPLRSVAPKPALPPKPPANPSKRNDDYTR